MTLISLFDATSGCLTGNIDIRVTTSRQTNNRHKRHYHNSGYKNYNKAKHCWVPLVKSRCDPLQVVYRLVDGSLADGFTKIDFAVPKSIGKAVVRNRARRRLKAILRELSDEHPDLIVDGYYLFRVFADIERFSYTDLHSMVVELLVDTKTKRSRMWQSDEAQSSKIK